ncbi:ribonuclease T2-like isoform X2 [Oncorhynchus keta]|uniref:ribonuclease T2-like isoform X2 n=1 Tax=Oncorhynchus keta TaxID=8018 RepID=UPI0015FA6132|nr:ribonuclease T2-like isoform X2 [Oncorhynchus keta]
MSGLLMMALLTVLTLTLESDHWTAGPPEKIQNHSISPRFCTWQCLKLTLQWPGSFCLGLKNSSQCRIPPNIQNWTIHGLPLKAHTCCRCWPIFHSDLKELDPELSQLWPSLLKTHSSFLFWKDEWIKHGSCAACVEGMNSPLLYFQICLKLRERFDIDRALEDAGIKPSCNQSYQSDEVKHALAPVIGDDPGVQIQCINEKGREVLVQVKIPLSQNLTLGCLHEEDQGTEPQPTQLWHPCPHDSHIFYFPIKHDRPHQPCD